MNVLVLLRKSRIPHEYGGKKIQQLRTKNVSIHFKYYVIYHMGHNTRMINGGYESNFTDECFPANTLCTRELEFVYRSATPTNPLRGSARLPFSVYKYVFCLIAQRNTEIDHPSARRRLTTPTGDGRCSFSFFLPARLPLAVTPRPARPRLSPSYTHPNGENFGRY